MPQVLDLQTELLASIADCEQQIKNIVRSLPPYDPSSASLFKLVPSGADPLCAPPYVLTNPDILAEGYAVEEREYSQLKSILGDWERNLLILSSCQTPTTAPPAAPAKEKSKKRAVKGRNPQPEVRILPELLFAQPPCKTSSYNALEASCLAHGIADPLKVFCPKGEEDLPPILWDGHTRYNIAKKHGLAYHVDDSIAFDTVAEAVTAILEWQEARRNLNDNQRRHAIGQVLVQKRANAMAESPQGYKAALMAQYGLTEQTYRNNVDLALGASAVQDRINAMEQAGKLDLLSGLYPATVQSVPLGNRLVWKLLELLPSRGCFSFFKNLSASMDFPESDQFLIDVVTHSLELLSEGDRPLSYAPKLPSIAPGSLVRAIDERGDVLFGTLTGYHWANDIFAIVTPEEGAQSFVDPTSCKKITELPSVEAFKKNLMKGKPQDAPLFSDTDNPDCVPHNLDPVPLPVVNPAYRDDSPAEVPPDYNPNAPGRQRVTVIATKAEATPEQEVPPAATERGEKPASSHLSSIPSRSQIEKALKTILEAAKAGALAPEQRQSLLDACQSSQPQQELAA